jgi:hypothetical protein
MINWMDVALVVGALLGVGLWLQTPEDPTPAAPARPAPFWLLGAIVVVLFANQLLVAAQVQAWAGGGPILPHLPSWWFRTVDGPVVDWLQVNVPLQVLELSVLRVQAGLEVPVAWAALVGCAWLVDRSAYRALLQPWVVLAAAVGWTLTFCVIEIWVMNPVTHQDLWLRMLAVPATMALAWGLRRVPAAGGVAVHGLGGLGLGLLAAALLSIGMIGVCWCTLLYNLGDLGSMWPGACLLGLALLWLVVRSGRHGLVLGAPREGVRAVVRTGRAFLLLFGVASMPLRYRWGTELADGVLLGLAALALVVGVLPSARRTPVAAVVGLGVGTGLAALPVVLPSADGAMLQRAGLFLAGLAVGWVATEALSRPRPAAYQSPAEPPAACPGASP